MAVTFKIGPNNMSFFDSIGHEHGILAKQLEAQGVSFVIQFFVVEAKKDGKTFASVTLPVSTTALLKKSAEPALQTASAQLLMKFLVDVANNPLVGGDVNALVTPPPLSHQKLSDVLADNPYPNPILPPTPPKPVAKTGKPPKATIEDFIQEVTGGDPILAHAAKKIAEWDAGTILPPPTNKVVALKAAKALLQKVKGTSEGSVYTTIAMNDRTRMAIRIHGPTISIRVEGNVKASESDALQDYGITGKGHYWSCHYNLEGINQMEKLVGAILFDSRLGFTNRIGTITEVTNG